MPRSRRAGVTASEASRKRSAHAPVWGVSSSIGSGPSASRRKSIASRTAGADTAATTAAWTQRARALISEVLPEVHARVERRDLLGIAVEGQRLPAAQLAD